MGMTLPVPPLLGTAALAAVLGAPDLRLFDISFYLPTENQDPRARFEAAHIPALASSTSKQRATRKPICRTWSPPPAASHACSRA